jgi:5-methylcytosine-specific restriction protein A
VGLADLTEASAVTAAMAEYDRLGRDAFLGTHGFGKARTYFLVSEGRRYDLRHA